MIPGPWRILQLYRRGRAAATYADANDGPGMMFDRYGRQVGLQLLFKGAPIGLLYWLAPVNIVRYFEFPFVYQFLPERLTRCLDVSSPRLFSLFVAARSPDIQLRLINPDQKDLACTKACAQKIGLKNIVADPVHIETLGSETAVYDCIWAISVVEHISGRVSDGQAVRLMYNALKPGGRLILTVPVDRQFRVEYRDFDAYGTQMNTGSGYFFQRVYDHSAIAKRILEPLEQEPSAVRWFGENAAGRYLAYEKRWLESGWPATVEDAREIVDHYREYADWSEMPGMGICGLVIDKSLK